MTVLILAVMEVIVTVLIVIVAVLIVIVLPFSGTNMHIDPSVTDAYNGLISGHKWWIYLPKDLYEFMDEYSCDESCSDPETRGIFSIEAWYHTIYPQIR